MSVKGFEHVFFDAGSGEQLPDPLLQVLHLVLA